MHAARSSFLLPGNSHAHELDYSVLQSRSLLDVTVALTSFSIADVENFFPLISYKLNQREREQCRKLEKRVGQARERLNARVATDDDLYLTMAPGTVGDGYASVDGSSKAAGYAEVDQSEDSGMYSYADPKRLLKRLKVGSTNEKGEYIGVTRDNQDERQEETEGDPGYANVPKEGGYIELSEKGRGDGKDDNKDDSKDDGYIQFVSDETQKGGKKAKKDKKAKKEQKKKPLKVSITGDEGEGEGEVPKTPTGDGDESQAKSGSLLSRVGARMKGTFHSLSARRSSGGEKSPVGSPSFKRKREEMKLRVPVSELTNPEFQGTLQRRKHGIGRSNWDTGMLYILHQHTLYHCRSEDDEYATKDFPVFDYTVKPCETRQQDPAFELSHVGVNTESFRAENPEQRDKWIEALTKASQIEGLVREAAQFKLTDEEQDVYENPDDQSTKATAEEQDVYENPDDGPGMAESDDQDVYENSEAPTTTKTLPQRPKMLSKHSIALPEKTYQNVDIELYEDVEEELNVYRAVKSHQASDDDELSFKVGDLVLMDYFDDDNWWAGTLQNKATREFSGSRGFVPKMYFVAVTSNS